MYTGNTQVNKAQNNTKSVYPCVYREHSIGGSGALGCGRFIPVYTGNTRLRYLLQAGCTVYPCVYREHLIKRSLFKRAAGLSLCIQGTLTNR